MKRLCLAVTVLLATLFSSSALAAEITPQTFAKFSEVAGFERQYSQVMNIFLSNLQQGMLAGFQNGIGKKEIPAEVKEKITPLVRESAESLRTGFEKTFKEAVKLDDLVYNVYLPVYRKHFSEQEMQELIRFYSTPVGKKASSLTPSIMQESSEAFNKLYGKRVQELGGNLIKQELESLIAKVKEMAPPKPQ